MTLSAAANLLFKITLCNPLPKNHRRTVYLTGFSFIANDCVSRGFRPIEVAFHDGGSPDVRVTRSVLVGTVAQGSICSLIVSTGRHGTNGTCQALYRPQWTRHLDA